MRQRIIDFANKPSSRAVTINTIGNYLNVAFTALYAIVLVRVMTPIEYGVLSVLLGIVYVLANVLDFGVTANIYATLPKVLANNRPRVYEFIKSVFFFETLLAGITVLILMFAFPALDSSFFKTGESQLTLAITALSILFLIWQNFILNVLFASRKFLQANIYNNSQNVVKTLVIFWLIASDNVSPGAIVAVFGLAGPTTFFLLSLTSRRSHIVKLMKSKVRRAEFRLRYTATYFVATQMFNTGARMDLFLLSFFGLRLDVGYYGLAQKIILSIVTSVISITQVLSPAFAAITNRQEAKSELKHGFLYLLIPSSVFILLFLTPTSVFQLIFTDSFSKAAELARALVPAYILFTLGNLPLQFVLYTIRKPIYILYGNIVYFALMAGGNFYLIPRLGVNAVPVVNFAAILIPFLFLSYITYYYYQRLPQGTIARKTDE